MIYAFITLVIGFACGFAAGVKNAKSSKVGKAVDILDALKGKNK
jgi:hypothetical protein